MLNLRDVEDQYKSIYLVLSIIEEKSEEIWK